MKITIAALLVASLISSGFGTWWSTRPVVTRTPEQERDGSYDLHYPDTRWRAARGGLGLGLGLILTTAAGLCSLFL